MEFLITRDEFLVLCVPIAVYWVYSGLYMMFGPSIKYRLHTKRDEDVKNLVSKKEVVKGVILQHVINTSISYLALKLKSSGQTAAAAAASPNSSFMVVACQFLVAMFVHDSWQYFMHRYMHLNKFLYRNFHSWHHRVVVNYAFGAQYSHPLDGLLIETVAGALAFAVSGMSPRTAMYFFSFAAIKGVDDHCGYMMPWNPFHVVFGNNAAYHDVHHQLAGNKYNFAQPFFVMWDKALGTYMPYSLEKKPDGGFEARISKEGHRS